MGNSLEKTSDTITSTTDAFSKASKASKAIKSGICGYMMTVDEIINNQLKTRQLHDYQIDPLELNDVRSYSLEEKLSTTSNFSIINLAKNITGKENQSGFETIYEFLKLDIEEKVPKNKSNEVNDVLKDGLKQIQLEIEDLEKNLAEDETTQERKAQLKKFGLALNDWNVEESNNWTSISSQLLEFIQSHTDAIAFNKSKYLEAYITALYLYAFAKLRCEQTDSDEREPIIKQIRNVMDDACNLLRESLRNVTYHNAEASFKREQTPYIGIDELPGCGPADIFCRLHKGLKSATIQKFACEDNQIISFNNESQENDSFKFGFNKLQVLLPNTFGKHDKENKINVNVDVRIPFRFDLHNHFDIKRIWDYRREIWQFKSNEHQVYISPLVFKAIYEISAIYAVINDVEEEDIVVEKPCYSKLGKTFERILLYNLEITPDFDRFTENQEPWKV